MIEQRAKQPVIGAEVMPPFADAMRLVDREQVELRAGQQIAEMPRRGALGGDVEQVEIAGREALARLGAVVGDRGPRRRADSSEERRVGKGGGSTGRCRWSPYH